MSYQTFGDLKRLARYLVGETGSEPRTMEWISTAINAAYAEFCSEYSWSFRQRITTVTYPARASSLSISSYGVIQGVFCVGVGFLDWMPPLVLTARKERTTGYGTPRAWSVYSTDLYLFPTPGSDTNLKLYHLIDVDPLVNDSDEPIIPLAFRPYLAYGALAIMTATENFENPSAARMYRDIYEKGVRLAKMQEPGGALYKAHQDMPGWPTSGAVY